MNSSSRPTLYFEDLVVGEVRVSAPRTVTEAEIVAFAREYDPQYFHADPEAAKDHLFGGVAASGIHTMAIWRQLDHQIAGDVRWICGVGWENVRWAHALYPEDTVRARWELLSKRDSSKPGRGVVEVDYGLTNQRNEFVFRCCSTNLVEKMP